SNLPALEAVASECERRKIERVYCLGDVVGYAAEPAECIELVRKLASLTVLGNHDACVGRSEVSLDMNPLAAAGLRFSIDALSDSERAWLKALPMRERLDPATLVHASLDESEE